MSNLCYDVCHVVFFAGDCIVSRIHVFVRGCCGGAKSSDRFGGRGGFKNSNNYDDDGCDEDKTAVEHVMIDDVLSGAGNRQDCTAH